MARRPRPAAAPGLFGIKRRRPLRLTIALAFAAVSVFPLLFMVLQSFEPSSDILSGPSLTLSNPTLSNYPAAWTANSFGQYFVNSLYVSVATVVITVAFASLAAFAFARFRFRFREVIFYIFLGSLAVPSVELIMPQYLMMSRLHLIDSLQGLVLIYVSANLPFSIFLLRGFFEAIPRELEEAFRLDGAGTLRILTRLIMPLSAPALATVAVFTFNAAWDEFVIALTLINTPSHRTLPIGLALFIGAHDTAWGALFAGSVIATVPSILVYVLAQRWFQAGLSLGGLRDRGRSAVRRPSGGQPRARLRHQLHRRPRARDRLAARCGARSCRRTTGWRAIRGRSRPNSAGPIPSAGQWSWPRCVPWRTDSPPGAPCCRPTRRCTPPIPPSPARTRRNGSTGATARPSTSVTCWRS